MQPIQFTIIIVFVKTVLFQTIQFIISTLFSSILPIDTTLSGATTPGQRGPGSDGNKGYSTFPKTPALLKPHHHHGLLSYLGHSLGWGSYPSAEKHSVWPTAPAD